MGHSETTTWKLIQLSVDIVAQRSGNHLVHLSILGLSSQI